MTLDDCVCSIFFVTLGGDHLMAWRKRNSVEQLMEIVMGSCAYSLPERQIATIVDTRLVGVSRDRVGSYTSAHVEADLQESLSL